MDFEPQLPIPISLIGDKFFLFDIDTITWLRRIHHICGVMTGTLPQNPSQNVFLGLPVQIMPEEAQLLVEKGIGYILDDTHAHRDARKAENSARHADYMAYVRKCAEQTSMIWTGQKQEQKRQALSKQKSGRAKAKQGPNQGQESSSLSRQTRNETSAKMSVSNSESGALVTDENSEGQEAANLASTFNAARLPFFSSSPSTQSLKVSTQASEPASSQQSSLFDPEPDKSTSPSTKSKSKPDQLHDLPFITPTTSALFLPSEQDHHHSSLTTTNTTIPNLPSSYPLYRHLNSKSYFVTPGLRFGCQYCVYPGDPLRFHSHFLAVGYAWDQEIDLMDVVGGGRLGTGVKKGWLIGGEENKSERTDRDGRNKAKGNSSVNGVDDVGGGGSDSATGHDWEDLGSNENDDRRVRTFSIEWAAM